MAWEQRGSYMVDRHLSWIDAKRLFVKSLPQDGEENMKFKHNFNNLKSFYVKLIEIYILVEELNTKADNGNRIRMGVEVDDFDKNGGLSPVKGTP